MAIEIGKVYTLTRPPFILKGVIVQYRSSVEVKSKNKDMTYTVIYTDKEGYSHDLKGIKEEELEPQDSNVQ